MSNDQHMTFRTITIIGAFFAFFVLILGPLHSHAAATNNPTPEQGKLIASNGKINLNTANAEQIASMLKGIGLKKAEAIVEYRTTYGPFANIHELAEVKGIGTATLEKNASLITVE